MNLVHRLRFDLTCGAESQAFQLRHVVAHSCQGAVIDVMDRVISKYSTGDEAVVLDKIEIDLGTMTMEEFEQSFLQQFEHQFERDLQERFSTAGSERREIQFSQLLEKFFCQFALEGSVPWWFTATEDEFHRTVLRAVSGQGLSIKTFLLQQRDNPTLWKRISLQLQPAAQLAIIGLFEILGTSKVLMQQWAELAARQEIGKDEFLDKEDLIGTMVLQHAPFLLQSTSIKEDSATVFASAFLLQSDQTMNTDERTGVLQKIAALTGFPVSYPAIQNLREFVPGEQPLASLFKSADPLSYRERTEIQDEQNSTMVFDAGLVLLASFLPSFFSRLGLTENRKWKDRYSLYRGIHLLYFLATGRESPAEYLLTLPKLLTGCPREEAVPRDIELTEEEKLETERLLQSVIEYWTAIKNTSVHGLRETFLNRQGRLKRLENGWELLVERKTVDVLVDRLPWSFSVISFPWIHYLIHVEW